MAFTHVRYVPKLRVLVYIFVLFPWSVVSRQVIVFACVIVFGPVRLMMILIVYNVCINIKMGAQWFSGRVLDSRPRGRGFEPHRRHCFVVLEQSK